MSCSWSSRESFQLFTIENNVGFRLVIYDHNMLRYVSSVSTLLKVSTTNICWILSLLSLHLLRWSYDFYLLLVWYILLFSDVRPFLYSWSKVSLVIVYDLFSVWLSLVCWYYEFYFSLALLSDFCARVMVAS